MPVAYMIHGFVGVGKTTFSKKLQQETNAIRFSPDDWMTALYGANPPSDMFSEYEERIVTLIWTMVEQAIRAGADVILDFGFWKRRRRDEARSRLEAAGAKVMLYALHCPDEVMIERVLTRTREMPDGALFIDRNAIEEFRMRFEAADPESEDFVSIET